MSNDQRGAQTVSGNNSGGSVGQGDRILSDNAPLNPSPSEWEIRAFEAVFAPVRAWASPRFYGLENIPAEGPVLIVANHNLLGGIDAPLLMPEILRARGRLVRGLAEHVLMVPGVRHLLHRFGAVRGTRSNCLALLERGEAVVVFPGGGREAIRRKGEKYALKWDNRTGFARMAIQAGVPIVPLAMIGVDDAFDIVFDGQHPVMRPLRWTCSLLGINPELNPPMVKGIGPTPLPRPERFYYSAGTPIDPTPWLEAEDLDTAAADLRDVVRKSLEEELQFLFSERERDSGRTLVGRLRGALPF
ncbi:membrane protein [Nocardia neocaledoniensis NBRC 108232]|uniref:Acyltransferase-like protein n=1 Tax=Nocardia neocaledoniensis TaxID=236511 RepID=A0A317P405_9NOCA|nr:acyltransferase-like protein [Nocardia neocaledoniensis]GEM35104.1 membrane protein [Nocardia neocaledoniensis NBRC 108232]